MASGARRRRPTAEEPEADPSEGTGAAPRRGAMARALRWLGSRVVPSHPNMAAFVKQDFDSRLQQSCRLWAEEGYGVPRAIHVIYIVKMALYVWGIAALVPGGLRGLYDAASPEQYDDAFMRFVLYSGVFEVLGLGCGSGPLTAHYWPPFTAWWHFSKPGTRKLPLLSTRWLGTTRTWLDVLLWFALLGAAGRALWAPVVTTQLVLPVVILLPILGVLDRAIFLAFRAEHYYSFLVCFVLAPDATSWHEACKLVQIAIWVWAGVSKMGPWFETTVGIMVSNSPTISLLPLPIWRLLYKDPPRDFNPTMLCKLVAHCGTATEVTFPALLAFCDAGSPWQLIGIATCLGFHTFITSCFAMGAPQEWNIFNVTSALYLFAVLGPVDTSVVASLPVTLQLYLLCAIVLVPLAGNIWPEKVSFLLAMRYYAGNWPVSFFLHRKSAEHKFSALTKKSVSKMTSDQMLDLWPPGVALNLMYRVMSFRAMHMHGRLVPQLVKRALDGDVKDIDEWRYSEGELLAGVVLGYNFGDGHLHSTSLLRIIQEECNFEPGELFHVTMEPSPTLPLARARAIPWKITDASDPDNPIASGETHVTELGKMQPY